MDQRERNSLTMGTSIRVEQGAEVYRDLIYDVGMNNGEDTAYFLDQGHRVLAIEANPVLARQAERRFEKELRDGRLIVLNVGIAEHTGSAHFWISDDHSEWSSFDRNIASRSGSRHHSIEIPTTTFRQILLEHGTPHYLKIDIEGNDALCVQALQERSTLPKYISLETDCAGDSEDFTDVRSPGTLELLRDRGYDRFKLIYQSNFWAAGNLRGSHWLQRLATSAAHGRLRALKMGYVAMRLSGRHMLNSNGYTFVRGSSGPWGEATAGRWLSYREAKKVYLRTREFYGRGVKQSQPKGSFWFDWHASYLS
jgi:FkbM family methyltransferase